MRIKIKGKPRDLKLDFTPTDGTCKIDAAAGTASADVSIEDKSFTMSYDESTKADAKLKYKDSVTYAAQNVALYADADTPGSSVGSLTLSDKSAKGSVTFSDTTLTFVADFEIVCP